MAARSDTLGVYRPSLGGAAIGGMDGNDHHLFPGFHPDGSHQQDFRRPAPLQTLYRCKQGKERGEERRGKGFSEEAGFVFT